MTTDAELIAWSLAGDGDAFATVVDRHEQQVAASLAPAGRERLGDVLGATWVAAFGARASYDRSVPDALPWL